MSEFLRGLLKRGSRQTPAASPAGLPDEAPVTEAIPVTLAERVVANATGISLTSFQEYMFSASRGSTGDKWKKSEIYRGNSGSGLEPQALGELINASIPPTETPIPAGEVKYGGDAYRGHLFLMLEQRSPSAFEVHVAGVVGRDHVDRDNSVDMSITLSDLSLARECMTAIATTPRSTLNDIMSQLFALPPQLSSEDRAQMDTKGTLFPRQGPEHFNPFLDGKHYYNSYTLDATVPLANRHLVRTPLEPSAKA